MNVTIYSGDNCAYCTMVKQFLGIKKVPFTEINVDQQPEKRQEAIDLSGAMTVPVTVFEKEGNKDVVIGYNPGALGSALSK